MDDLLFGGEACDPERAREAVAALASSKAASACRLRNGYGPTESTTFATSHRVREVAADAASVPIGRPIADTSAHVTDRTLRPVPTGIPGELVIGGDGLARGYWKRPAITAERFIPDPFSDFPGSRLYKTGDLVRLDATGRIDFQGRFDHQVKIRGFRIELGEIESRLARHPAVAAQVVVAREDVPGSQRLVAYAVPEEGASLDHDALRKYLADSLPDFMVPSAVVVLDALPLNPIGKVDRAKLPAP
jgi:acyl-coenzyme A synthetase/AMP-(fatty) acid ligase